MGQCHSWLSKSTVDIKLWNDEQIQDIDPQGQGAIVPDNAVNLDIQTLEFGDASTEMACIAVYAKFQRKNGM